MWACSKNHVFVLHPKWVSPRPRLLLQRGPRAWLRCQRASHPENAASTIRETEVWVGKVEAYCDVRKRRAVKKKVEGENRFPPRKRSERCPGGRAAKPSTPIGPEDRVLERLKSASGGDRELWREGRSKPNPKAEIPTFRVGRSQKTAGRDHRSPFGRLVVLSEGGTAKPEGPSSGLPPARRASLILQPDPAADRSCGGRNGAFPPRCAHRGTVPGSAGSGLALN